MVEKNRLEFDIAAARARCVAATTRARKTQALLLEALKALPPGDLSPTEANMIIALNGACENIAELAADLPAALEALEEAQKALRALSWQEPDGTRHWCESAARGESDIAVNDCNCDEARAILKEGSSG